MKSQNKEREKETKKAKSYKETLQGSRNIEDKKWKQMQKKNRKKCR